MDVERIYCSGKLKLFTKPYFCCILIFEVNIMKFNYQENANASGIYKIINNHTNRIYIGQAKSFKERWHGHSNSLRSGKHQNKFIQSDYNKCKAELGHDDFLEFHVIKIMAGSTKEERNIREEQEIALYFDQGKQCYNFNKQVNQIERSFFSSNPEETKKKMSDSIKQIWINIKSDTEKFAAYKEQKRLQAIKMHSDPELKAKIIKGHSDPEVRKIMSVKSTERQSDPAYRERISQGMKNYYINNPEQININAERLIQARKLINIDPEKKKIDDAKRTEALRANCKPCNFIDPSGKEITVVNVKKWAEDNGFSEPRFYQLLNGSGYNKDGTLMRVYGYTKPGCIDSITIKTLIDRNGNEESFTNLVEWCRTKNLDPCTFYLLLNRKAKSAHGYTLPDFIPVNNSITLIDPEGNKIFIEDRLLWCKQMGFRIDSVKRMINKKAKSFKGYTLPKDIF